MRIAYQPYQLETYKMIKRACKYAMKVIIDCMSKSRAAASAGIALAPICNWADLDSLFLTNNNPGLSIPDNNF